MAVKSSDQIIQNIQQELADNNAGSISAYDVRHNMEDIVDSIIPITSSGLSVFKRDIRLEINNLTEPQTGGILTVESGISFPNSNVPNTFQTEPYPGASSINHNNLTNLINGDPHTQYLHLNGVRVMASNLGLDNNWINSSGNSSVISSDNRGFRFERLDSSNEIIHVGNKSTIEFDKDGSTLSTSRGNAKAWLRFDSSVSPPVVNSFYNIEQLEKISEGQFKITFTSGTFLDNNYLVFASSNGRSTASNITDFAQVTVGTSDRIGDDQNQLRSVTFAVLDDSNTYVNAKINEFVAYGVGPGESVGSPPTVVV